MTSSPSKSEQSTRALSRVGKVVDGKWTIERVLGSGGMATVYLAVHRHTQRRAAIKVLHQEYLHIDEIRERFAQEARAANRVNHRGAVPVLDDGVLADGAPYLVMDFLDGQSLQDRFEACHQKLSVEEVFAICERLLDILESAHVAGVLHRDIKPENVYLTNEGEVKLLDFGISKVTDEKQNHETKVGSMMGTPAFMSPEQARGRWAELDPRADVFAVGATMYAMLTGEAIHQAETSNELLLKVMTEPVSDIRRLAPNIPDFAAKVVNRALRFEKEDRFKTAGEMRDAVKAVNARFNRGLPTILSQEELLRDRLSTIPDVVADRSTHRPVMFSRLTAITLNAAPLTREKKWALSAVALLMTITAVFTYSVVSEPEENETLSPVSASAGLTDASLKQGKPSKSEVEQAAQPPAAFELSDLPEAEPEKKKVPEAAPVRRFYSPQPPKNPADKKAQEVAEEPQQKAEVDPLARRR